MRWRGLIVGTVAATLALAPAAHAADFTVTGTADIAGTAPAVTARASARRSTAAEQNTEATGSSLQA